MHDIIISQLIQSERTRLDIGANRLEESQPLQSLFRKTSSLFSFRLPKRAGQRQQSAHHASGDCACHPAR